MTSMILLEGGGTRTRAALILEDGTRLNEQTGGPSNPAAYGIAGAVGVIVSLSKALMAGRTGGDIRLYAGLAGAGEATVQKELASAVGEALALESVWITSDLHMMLHANAGAGSGILVIAGTGAAVLAKTVRGRLLRTGGWGPLLGDEGSAYSVAVAGLRAAARALDGVGPETCMTRELPYAAGLQSCREFSGWALRASKRDIAGLATVVSAVADAGDFVARACIEEEARRLAALAIAAQERLGLDKETRLFEYGGLLDGCAIYRNAFRDAIHVYSELQAMSCPVRGLDAVQYLAGLEELPPWISGWIRHETAEPARLPDTEKSRGDRPLDELSTAELVECMQRADQEAVDALGGAADTIADVIDWAARCIRAGGRLIYAGAGTSGRLGALDAAECPPTFGVAPDRVIALIAGGDRALRGSVEGAEDDYEQGSRDAEALHPNEKDFLIGIAASGTTPYVAGALEAGRNAGAKTALVTSNTVPTITADFRIILNTGPEALPGSTRLKAGTAAKMALNRISTGAMARAGLIYKGLMAGMTPVNKKLRRRAERIVAELAGISEEESKNVLEQAKYRIAVAVVMAKKDTSTAQAEALLQSCGNRLRDALEDYHV